MYENDRIQKVNDGAYNNVLLFLVVGALFYILVKGWDKAKKQALLNGVGTDKNTQQAQALHDAFNPSGQSLLIGLDFTDTTLVFPTAQQITDYQAVSDAYRSLYGRELTTDLQNELSRTDSLKFFDIINSKTTGGTTTGGTTTGGTTGTVNNSLVGKTVTAIGTANIRSIFPPYDVESNFLGNNTQAKKGDVLGTYVSEMLIPNVPTKGDKLTYVRYKTFSVFTWLEEEHYVLKSYVSIK